MSIFKKIGRLFKSTPAVDRVVAALKQTKLGDATVDSIQAVANSDLSGAQKFERVVAEISPLVVEYVRAGGGKAAVTDVEDLTRTLVQSVYTELKSVGFTQVAATLMRLLKL
jgi:hypothetical protein